MTFINGVRFWVLVPGKSVGGGAIAQQSVYGIARWEVVSLNRLSFGCGTTPRRQSGYINGFCLGSSRDL